MKRAFCIFRCQHENCWRWECSLCDPPAFGARQGADAWHKILTISLPGHMSHRWAHHKWVAAHR